MTLLVLSLIIQHVKTKLYGGEICRHCGRIKSFYTGWFLVKIYVKVIYCVNHFKYFVSWLSTDADRNKEFLARIEISRSTIFDRFFSINVELELWRWQRSRNHRPSLCGIIKVQDIENKGIIIIIYYTLYCALSSREKSKNINTSQY